MILQTKLKKYYYYVNVTTALLHALEYYIKNVISTDTSTCKFTFPFSKIKVS